MTEEKISVHQLIRGLRTRRNMPNSTGPFMLVVSPNYMAAHPEIDWTPPGKIIDGIFYSAKQLKDPDIAEKLKAQELESLRHRRR
jgi:hypothetical protein